MKLVLLLKEKKIPKTGTNTGDSFQKGKINVSLLKTSVRKYGNTEYFHTENVYNQQLQTFFF